MKIENQSSKPETELKQEAGEDCSGATCSLLENSGGLSDVVDLNSRLHEYIKKLATTERLKLSEVINIGKLRSLAKTLLR